MKHQYPVAIHKDEGSAYGVTVPDIPGCFAAGDSIEEALLNARQAIKLHVGALVEAGYSPKFSASSIDDLMSVNAELFGAQWVLLDVDL